MVSQTEVRASNAALAVSTTPRVAVFVGATDGIGKSTLQQLVSRGLPIRAYIVGRDEAAFRPVLDELRRVNESADLVFLQGQVSLLSDTKRVVDEIISREQSIDLLFLSSGFLPFRGHEKTSEGLELAFAVAYYSRQIFIRRLLPLLRAAANTGTGSYTPRVVNVLGTGVETKDLFLDDLDLQRPGRLNVPNFTGHIASRTSIALKRLAEKPENKGVVIVHSHPGSVSTNIFKKSWGDQWAEDGSKAPKFYNLVHSTPQEAGERSLYVITSAKYGGDGVPLQRGQEHGLTVKGELNGSLFCVGDSLDTLELGELLSFLESSGAGDVIWNKTEEIIGKYL
ncbi:hypothetical protein QBC42DRAFT_324213 [Cladorrhinum samala]|uniref:Uncharacterized protein n=1 Tax=Cladorrhinum samala TaxID=585594 RepID=A0AAV9HRH5_9PEZI|nr:hypothetical protein QBC42DRAFT_324213 [Cladorrhinum samala]